MLRMIRQTPLTHGPASAPLALTVPHWRYTMKIRLAVIAFLALVFWAAAC